MVETMVQNRLCVVQALSQLVMYWLSLRNTLQTVHGKVAAAVRELQGALQAELHEDQLQLFRRLGAGGFGTVYHGMVLFTWNQVSSTNPDENVSN